MRIFFVILLIVVTPVAFGQNEWWKRKNQTEEEEKTVDTVKESQVVVVPHNDIKPGKVNVSKSSLVDKVIDFKAATVSPYIGPVQDGYRVQVFFDQDRKEVDKARTKVMTLDNDTPTYIEYKAPNYLLLIGDYRTRLEAEKASAKLLHEFPAAIIKEAKIYMPKLNE